MPRLAYAEPLGILACGGWIDCRDLGHVLDHEGPLPHPAQDRPQ
jgi:hypothetical protein